MPIPNRYQITGDNKVISLSLSDTATGKGYITLYPAGYYNGAGGSNIANYVLLPSAFPAGKLNTATTGGSTLNFDIKILKPIIIEGNAFFTFTTESPVAVGGSSTIVLQASGAVITTLASASGALTSASTARRHIITLNVPRTVIKINETIRVQVQTGNQVGEATTIWHDPSTRKKTTQNEAETGTTENTDFIVNLPIKII